MFDSFRRLQLKRKGLSCGRRRRKQSDNALLELFWENPWIKACIFVGFLASSVLLILYRPGTGTEIDIETLRTVSFGVVVFFAALAQFYLNHPRNFQENGRVLLIFGSVFLNVALVWGVCHLIDSNNLPSNYVFLLSPVALAPMLISVMLGRGLGVFAAVFATLYSALIVPTSEVLPFIIVGLIASVAGVYVTDQTRRRSRLIRAGFYTGLVILLLGLVVGYVDLSGLWSSGELDWRVLISHSLMPIGVGMATATIVGGILPMIESLFRVTTEISWLELSDLNHPLLRRMTLEAPGTYHHSLVVANLSEAAAETIGCNATMCRVCAYFHDIGKLVKPEYCIENIGEAENPHDDLTPSMSVLIIMSHVKDGVDLAIKHKMNNAIIDVIEEHHGTSLVYFFYRRALDQREEVERLVAEGKANEEDVPDVDEESFRYPGPKPSTRESGIISLADAVEGASRTLQKPTPLKIEQLIDEIVRSRVRDGQLDECDLTLHELTEIKKSFSTTLRSMMHNRITYPKATTEDEDQKKEERRTQGKAIEKKRKAKVKDGAVEQQVAGSGKVN